MLVVFAETTVDDLIAGLSLHGFFPHDTIHSLYTSTSRFRQAPGISLFRYGHNGDGLASKKCPMCDRNGDENGSKFRMVRYYVGTRGDRR